MRPILPMAIVNPHYCSPAIIDERMILNHKFQYKAAIFGELNKYPVLAAQRLDIAYFFHNAIQFLSHQIFYQFIVMF
jgi:hypothetical protein